MSKLDLGSKAGSEPLGVLVHVAVGRKAGDNSTAEAEVSSDDGQLLVRRDPPPWLRQQRRLVVLLDVVAATGATLLARFWAFGASDAVIHVRSVDIPYSAAVVVAVPIWLVVLYASRCYDFGPFGVAEREVRRVVSAGAHFLAGLAIVYYLVSVERVAREFLMAIIPLAVTLTLAGRWLARRHLLIQRRHGQADRRALFIGPTRATDALHHHLSSYSNAGLSQASVTNGDASRLTGVSPNGSQTARTAKSLADVFALLPITDADLVVVTGALGAGELRQLTWKLEGTGIDVLVAPTAGQLTGPQLGIRPVAGLPLLYVDR